MSTATAVNEEAIISVKGLTRSFNDLFALRGIDIDFIRMSDKFQYGMSIEVLKYGMSKAAYDFWENVKTQGEYNGSFFGWV